MTVGLRATVAISAHYIPARIRFLSTVLDAILGWPMAAVEVILVSNDPAIMQEEAVLTARRRFAERDWRLRLEHATDLAHPFLLTWSHKTLIPPWLSTAGPSDDFFIYVEDDMVLTRENIEYFARSISPLGKYGLIPGFLRYEVREDIRYSVDITEPQLVSIYPTKAVQDLKFVCPVNPHWAGFILDRRLAQEYVDSDSFDLEGSLKRWNIDVRERAAMGLTWEAIPRGYKSRCVVPIRDGGPAEECLVWHCAQNYTAASDSRFGTLPIADVFVEGDLGMLLSRAVRKVGRRLRKS